MNLTIKAWFRAISSLFVEDTPAQAFAGLSVLAIAIYTGELSSFVGLLSMSHQACRLRCSQTDNDRSFALDHLHQRKLHHGVPCSVHHDAYFSLFSSQPMRYG